MTLKNKVALVTGSSSGIGRAIAIALAKEGTKVVINCRTSKESAEEVAKEIRDAGGDAEVVVADASVLEDVKKLFIQTVEKFGGIDILVNNASKQGGNDFLESDLTAWSEHYQQNLMSAVMCSQEFLNLNKGKTEKKIVNISSILGIDSKSSKNFTAYSAAKSGVNNLTTNIARFAGPTIQVNAVAPGYTLTPFWNGVPENVINACADETLIKRMIQPEEIAHAVVFLCENDAITGQIISIDGGVRG